jgi:hypothetical protein
MVDDDCVRKSCEPLPQSRRDTLQRQADSLAKEDSKMPGPANAVYLKACVDAVAAQLGNDEFIIGAQMGALIPSHNAVFPFLVTIGALDGSGQGTGRNRAVIVDVTSNTPPTCTIRGGLDLGPSWSPL